MRGIHVGLSQTSKTFMIYVPSTGRIYHTRDCYFDENYESTLAYKENKFSGYMHLHVTEPFRDTDLPFHRVGYPKKHEQQQPDDENTDGGGDNKVGGDLSSTDDGGDNEVGGDLSSTSDDEHSISTTGDIGGSTTSAEELGSHKVQNTITVTQLSQVESANDEPPLLLRRSARRKFPSNRYAHDAHAAISKSISEIPQDLLPTNLQSESCRNNRFFGHNQNRSSITYTRQLETNSIIPTTHQNIMDEVICKRTKGTDQQGYSHT
jgi:hypothetical protein